MKFFRLNWLVVMLLVIPFVTVVAGESSKAFDDLDNNGDGYISKSEATSRADLRQSWNSVDANKDGKLNEAEFSAFESIPPEGFPEK